MTIDYYYAMASPPCRTVFLVAEAIGVKLNPILLDVMKKEHLTKDYLEINPQHTVPTIVDNGFVLTESRAIIIYLVDKYGKIDSFYPRDIKKHTKIHQKLFFDNELSAKLGAYIRPQFFGGPADPEILQKVIESVAFLDAELEGKTFVTGENFTIADVALLVTLSTMELLTSELNQFKNIPRYLTKCKETAVGYDGMAGKMRDVLAAFIQKTKTPAQILNTTSKLRSIFKGFLKRMTTNLIY